MSPRSGSARKGADLTRSARLFSALGDRTRLRIVDRLSAGAATSIAQLTAGTDMTRQAVTKHLRVLEGAGLIQGVRHGRECLWQLERERLDEAQRLLAQISAQWDAALARLKAFVE